MAERRALLIGVPEYHRSEIPKLSFIQNDIERLTLALQSSDYAVQTIGVDGKQATTGIIYDAIENICNTNRKIDTLLICFSGHGLHHEGQDYLVPYDGSVSSTNLQRTLVPVDFADIFENSSAKTILFFIDACREGIDFGTKNIAPYQRWSHGKLKKVRDREVAHIFACQAGEVARYVTSEDGQFSLFSRALEEVIHKDCQATTFDEVTKALQQKLDELSTTYGKAKQTIRINTEAGVGDESLYQRTICLGPQPKRKVVPQKDIWRQAITDSQLWATKGVAQNKATEKLRQGTFKLIEVCRQQWQQAELALPDDPWRDKYFPLRMLDRIEFLVSLCKDLELSVSEKAILLVTPFVREAVLASAVTAAAQANPYSMEATGSAEGFRGHLEKIHLSFPQLIRKIERLQGQKGEESQIDQQAIATWLMYRCILRTPEVWMDPPGYIPTDLLDLIEEFKQGSDAVIRDTFSRHRLLEIARCINTDLERIERGDRPGALQREDFAAAGSSNEQRIREKMLAYLINLAGWMAIDARILSEVLVDHVGLNDPLKLEQVRRVIKEAKWKSDGPNRVLKALCHHPATDLALQDHVAQASDILDRLQQKIHKKEDCLEVLTGLPQRLLAHEIKAAQLADGPVYETPHLQFQLSHNDVRELLMGESLYGDPTLAIRELYQNALDACRYREARTTYLQRTGQYQGDDWEGLIVFRQDEEDGRPYIECEDNGIGMGRRELTDAFSRAGRRFADMPEFIEEQAEWLRCDPPIRLYPNSQFGIGVFSYFMLADELLIRTCRLDRDGQPGALLEVKVAGSGSLFRVRPMPKGKRSGTLIRLYLTEAITQNQQEPVSCLRVLRELLRVALFRTEVHEHSETDVWMPGELKWPGAKPEDIIATNHPDVWWVKFDMKDNLFYRAARIGKNIPNVILLADGIVIDRTAICAVVNLRNSYKPKLKVDRQGLLVWDKEYVLNLLRESISVLADNPDWLTCEWLWKLEEKADVETARQLALYLIEHGFSIKLAQYNVQLPVYRLGFTLLDRLQEHGIPQEHDRSQEYLRRLMSFPNILQPSRTISLLSIYRLDYWLNNLADQITELVSEPALLPGDGILLSRQLYSKSVWLEKYVPSGHLVQTALKLDWSVAKVYEQLSRFVPLGLQLPDVDYDYLINLKLTQDDRGLLLHDFYKQPWLEDKVSAFHLIQAALKLNWSVAKVYEQLSRFVPLGLQLPDVDYDYLTSLQITPDDRVLFFRGFYKQPWFVNEVSTIRLIQAALKLNWSVAKVYEQLSRFVPLGLQLPDVDYNYLINLKLTQDDRGLLLQSLHGNRQWLKNKMSAVHLIQAVFDLDWSISQIYEWLSRFVPLGLQLPEIDLGYLTNLEVTHDDLVLLSDYLDGRKPWLENAVPALHLIQAALKFNWSVAHVYARLQRFVPLGLYLPEVDQQDLTNLEVTHDDLVLLSDYLDGQEPWLGDTVSASHIIQAAQTLNWSIAQVYERLWCFVPLGLELPDLDAKRLNGVQFINTDLILLSRHLDENLFGGDTRFHETIPISHIFVAAKVLEWPVERVYTRFLELAPLGLQVPQIPLEQLEDLEPSLVELIVLSENCTALPPYLDNVVSAEHFARAMCKIAIPATEVLRRLQRFVPFGLVLPSLEEIEEASKR